MMFFLNRKDALFILLFAAVLLLVFPLAMDSFRLNLMGNISPMGLSLWGMSCARVMREF
jgi:hypothetical protein